MDLNFFKNVFNRCKEHYLKMFILGLGVVFLTCIAFLLTFWDSSLELVSYMIVLFGVLPMLLSYQLVCSRLFTNHEVNYNEIYKNYKAYYSPIFRGCFGVLLTLLLMFATYTVLSTIFIMANYDLSSLNEIVIDYQVTKEIYEEMLKIMQKESYNYFMIFCLGMISLIAIYRTLTKMVIPYFNFFLGIPTPATKKILFQIKISPNSKYKKQLRTIVIPFLLIFLISFFITGYSFYYFKQDFGLALVLSFCISTLCCSFYLPIYVAGCYELFSINRHCSLGVIKSMLNQDLTKILSDPRIDNDLKERIKGGLDSYKDKLNDISQNEDDSENK